MIDNTTIIVLIIFLVLGILFLTHTKSIARHLANNSISSLKWIFGEVWAVKEQIRAEKFYAIALPIASIFCFGVIALLIYGIFFGHPNP